MFCNVLSTFFAYISYLYGQSAAKRVAAQLDIDEYISGVLPENKSEFISALNESGVKAIMVGDGVNDAPALAAADVSAAMCDGSDIACEVADIMLHNDELSELVTLRVLSQSLMKRISENYRFIVGFNAALIFLGAAGVIAPGTSIISNHTFVDGSKRTGIHLMLIFLSLNKIELTYTQQELIDLGLGIAAGEISPEQLLEWLKEHS